MNIPEEIIHDEILLRLPVKALLKFRCVCKAWRDLIGNPRFKDSHLNHPSQKTRTGSLFLKQYDDGNTTLSLRTADSSDFPATFPQDSEWRITFPHPKLEIGSPCNGPILLGHTFTEGNEGYLLDGCGLCLDGILHWRMGIRNVDEEIILSFDLTTEEMIAISLPRWIEGASQGLLVLENCLALAVIDHRGRTVPCWMEIWVMGEYSKQESWTRRFWVGPFDEIPRFLSCWNEDVLLFETRERELASCNLKKDVGQLKKHGIHGNIDVETDIRLGAIVMQKESLPVQLF